MAAIAMFGCFAIFLSLFYYVCDCYLPDNHEGGTWTPGGVAVSALLFLSLPFIWAVASFNTFIAKGNNIAVTFYALTLFFGAINFIVITWFCSQKR